MIRSLREDLDVPDLLVLLGVNTRFGGGRNPHLADVITAQQAFAEGDPNASYVDTSGATIANSVHFDGPGTLDVGERFAAALMELQQSQSQPRSGQHDSTGTSAVE